MKPKLTSELAEFMGILTGDGHVTFKTRQNKILITGNLKTDLNYLKYHVKLLIQNLFNIKPSFTYRKDRNALIVYFYSKEIVDFFKNLGFYKLKTNIRIPPQIYQDSLNMRRFIRGLFDTDGSIFISNKNGALNYPCIELTTISKNLGILTTSF
jgi:intein/homing endonuclease